MKASDIRVQAQLKYPRQINAQFAIKYINLAMQELATQFDTARTKATTEIAATAFEWYDLPDGLIEVIRVEYGSDKQPYDNFRIEGSQIQFDNDDTYTIVYGKYPTDIINETETPEIPVPYHAALVYYVASQERGRMFGVSDQNSMVLDQQFWIKSSTAHKTVRGKKGTRKIVAAPTW